MLALFNWILFILMLVSFGLTIIVIALHARALRRRGELTTSRLRSWHVVAISAGSLCLLVVAFDYTVRSPFDWHSIVLFIGLVLFDTALAILGNFQTDRMHKRPTA